MRFAEEVDYRMCSTRDEEDDRVSCSSLALTIMIIMLAPHETSKKKGVLILFFGDLWLVILILVHYGVLLKKCHIMISVISLGWISNDACAAER